MSYPVAGDRVAGEEVKVIDATTLYYTLSTIAQALASAMGVLAAFALFRLNRLESDVVAAQQALSDIGLSALWPILRDRGFDALLKQVRTEVGITSDRHPALRAGHNAWRIWSTLRYRLIATVIVMAVDVGACVVALPFVPAMASSGALPWLSWPIVALTVVLTIVSLFFAVRLIEVIIQPRE